MVTWKGRKISSPKRPPTSQAPRTRRARPVPTTWYAPGPALMGCRPW
jgi:hypothetical protein